MFGNLTLAFVQFGTAVQKAFASGASPAAMQELSIAGDHFKTAASNDALYLVCIGMFLLACPFGFLPPSSMTHSRDGGDGAIRLALRPPPCFLSPRASVPRGFRRGFRRGFYKHRIICIAEL